MSKYDNARSGRPFAVFRGRGGAPPACWDKGSGRGCLVEAFKTSNGVADGTPSFEAVVVDPDQSLDHWDEIDTKAEFDEAERELGARPRRSSARPRRRRLPRMTEIDYAKVNRYWEGANPSVLGPYMMDESGFPASAGDFRFRAESRIVRRLAGDVKRDGAVLDLGSGIGVWAKEFARRFSRVTAVEGSHTLFRSLQSRCAP